MKDFIYTNKHLKGTLKVRREPGLGQLVNDAWPTAHRVQCRDRLLNSTD
jgi:hypothetical protein